MQLCDKTYKKYKLCPTNHTLLVKKSHLRKLHIEKITRKLTL